MNGRIWRERERRIGGEGECEEGGEGMDCEHREGHDELESDNGGIESRIRRSMERMRGRERTRRERKR